MTELVPPPDTGDIELPNGCHLYWKTDHSIGGTRTYYSDEIGGGVMVWCTALTDQSTLLAAIVQEQKFQYLEHVIKERKTK